MPIDGGVTWHLTLNSGLEWTLVKFSEISVVQSLQFCGRGWFPLFQPVDLSYRFISVPARKGVSRRTELGPVSLRARGVTYINIQGVTFDTCTCSFEINPKSESGPTQHRMMYIVQTQQKKIPPLNDWTYIVHWSGYIMYMYPDQCTMYVHGAYPWPGAFQTNRFVDTGDCTGEV